MRDMTQTSGIGGQNPGLAMADTRSTAVVVLFALALLLFGFEPKIGVALLLAGLVLSVGFTRPLYPALIVFSFLWVNDVLADFLPFTQATAWKDGIILFLFITWLFRSTFLRRPLAINSLITIPLIIVMLHYVVMTAMSPSVVHAVLGLKATVFYMTWFFVMPDVVRSKADARKLVFALLFGTVCLSAYNLWRAQQPLGTFPVRRDGKFLPGDLEAHFSGAIYLLAPGLLITYAFFLGSKGRQRALLFVILALVTASLIATNGRGSWITTFGAIVVMSALSRRYAGLALFVTLGIALAITGAVQTTSRSSASDRAASAFNQQDVSRNAREEETTDLTVPFILQHPLGVGTGSMTAVGSAQTWGSRDMDFVLNGGIIHNTFLLVAIEIGWSGMIFYMLMLIAVVRASLQLYRQTVDPYLKQLALGLVGVTIAFAAMHFFALMITAPLISVIIWPLIGLIPVIKLLDEAERPTGLPDEAGDLGRTALAAT
jgi:O-antigen ligase